MSLAIKRLKNIGWVALVFIIALLLYPLSLNVAAVHSDLVDVDRQIMETKREIDFLEAELRTRASLGQLEEWNDLLYGYAPPTAEQFLESERSLASLGKAVKQRKPVLVSAGSIAPAGIVGNGRPTESAGEKPLSDDEQVKIAQAETKERDPVVSKEQGRTERLSKMDEQLLSDDLLKDLERKSKKEQAGR